MAHSERSSLRDVRTCRFSLDYLLLKRFIIGGDCSNENKIDTAGPIILRDKYGSDTDAGYISLRTE